MSKLEQAARQALSTDEALMALELILRDGIEHGNWPLNKNCEDGLEAITALREALAEQAEQEPDYFGLTHDHTWLSIDKKQYDKLKPEGRMTCYAAPVHTVDLSDYEIRDIWHSADTYDVFCVEFARAVIAAFKEKNQWNS